MLITVLISEVDVKVEAIRVLEDNLGLFEDDFRVDLKALDLFLSIHVGARSSFDLHSQRYVVVPPSIVVHLDIVHSVSHERNPVSVLFIRVVVSEVSGSGRRQYVIFVVWVLIGAQIEGAGGITSKVEFVVGSGGSLEEASLESPTVLVKVDEGLRLDSYLFIVQDVSRN